jgi:hypothetical protein
MACLPWVFMVLAGAVFIPTIGVFLYLIVKMCFFFLLLMRLRQPWWLMVFPLSGLPFVELFYWIFLVVERSGELYVPVPSPLIDNTGTVSTL